MIDADSSKSQAKTSAVDPGTFVPDSGDGSTSAGAEFSTTDNLLLASQPIVDTGSGAARAYELLVRMRRTDGSIAMPGEFLPGAEEAGLTPTIDSWVVSQAIVHLGSSTAQEADWRFNVNLSATTIESPGFVGRIEQILSQCNVSASRLCFEVTESRIFFDLPQATEALQRLRDLGAYIALDDFGTGFNSLERLRACPVDYLKIDGVFVRGMLAHRTDMIIVRSLVDLAHALDLKVVAEYVEDEATAEALKSMGVDLLQGYALGRPVDISELH